jgi:hypothetical protein
MSADNTKIRRITAAAVATVAVALLSGCATPYTGEQRLERFSVGENKVLALVRGVHSYKPVNFKEICTTGKLSSTDKSANVNEASAVSFLQQNVCPNPEGWKFISGFTKSDFSKGSISAAGLIRPGLEVEVNDIVEVSSLLDADGLLLRSALVTRVVRKNALKERDPTCYWDGQSGPLDSFATGGVVCPAEGWDWRNQKWAKK